MLILIKLPNCFSLIAGNTKFRKKIGKRVEAVLLVVSRGWWDMQVAKARRL